MSDSRSQKYYININLSIYRGNVVTATAFATGLILGIPYIWSIIKAAIPLAWGWTNADKAIPYSVMWVVFSAFMVPAGFLQDRYGPRWIVLLGGLISALGCIICGIGGNSKLAFIIGFGVFNGIGNGLGYSALTPAAIKWFSARRTGVVTGVVVAGFGLSPVFMAPLFLKLLTLFAESSLFGPIGPGISSAMVAMGLIMIIPTILFSQLVSNPPPLYMGEGPAFFNEESSRGQTREVPFRQMISTTRFWLYFLMYFCGASAGLVFISVAVDLGSKALGTWAFLAVIVMSLGNATGRILSGVISDKIGRSLALFVEFLFQGSILAILFFLIQKEDYSGISILLIIFVIGLNYGTNLTVFPAICKESFGLQSFGLNYGFLFTAFGLAGLVMPWLYGVIMDVTGKPDYAYLIIISLLTLSAVLALGCHLTARQKTLTREQGDPAGYNSIISD